MEEKNIDYDTHWKKVIEEYFQSFVDFFLPDLYPLVNFEIDPVFLDKELHEIIAEQTKGSRKGDQLVKVQLKSGKEQWLLIHIEVQSYPDKNFDLRMFSYYYRIWDRYGIDVIAMAIFTTEYQMPVLFEKKLFGTHLFYKYNHYYIKNQDKDELLQSDNVFGLVVLASLYALKSKKKSAQEQRLQFKKELLRLLIQKGFNRLNIEILFIFIHNIMALPTNLEIEFINEVEKLKDMNDSQEYINESTRLLAKRFYLALYGKDAENTVKVMEENIKLKQKNKAIEQENKTKQQKSIVNLFTKRNSTPEQIAEDLEIELTIVLDVLKKNELI